MSISKPSVKNPATKFIEFKSDEKQFVYYDKEQGKNVPVKLPFYFVVLDELHCMAGFNESAKSSFYSNEVHSLQKEPLTVRCFRSDYEKKGLYSEIGDAVKTDGGKYAKSIYALHIFKTSKDGPTEYELVNLKLSGAAVSEYMDFKFYQDKHMLYIKNEFKEGKKGKTAYNIPVFDKMELTPDILEEAINVDTLVLQPYFASKGVAPAQQVESSPEQPSGTKTTQEQPPVEEDDNNGLPF